MKKGLSVILVLALVSSLAAVLGACGKGGSEPTTETTEQTSANPYQDLLDEFTFDYADESYSYTERVTDEHYEEEYEALTLPTAKKDNVAVNATTTKVNAVRETTTKQFMFTSPTAPSTTKKNEATSSSAGSTTTTTTKPASQQATSASDSTSMTDTIPVTNAGFSGGNTTGGGSIARPQVTYLDKYVVDILAGNSYTAKTEMKADGMAVPVTYYANGNNMAVKMRVSSMLASEINMPGLMGLDEVRIITKGTGADTHIYLAWTGGYMEVEGEGLDEVKEMMGEMQANQDIRALLQTDRLEYCGIVSGVGYVCESYRIPEDNLGYCFYFTSEGITRWEVVDLETNQVVETMNISLKSGVSDSKAFTVSGKKYTMEEFEKMFEGIAG